MACPALVSTSAQVSPCHSILLSSRFCLTTLSPLSCLFFLATNPTGCNFHKSWGLHSST